MTARNLKTNEVVDIPTDYVTPHRFPDKVLNLKQRLEREFNVKFNSCLVGLFESPRDKIRFHDDSSPNMGKNPFVGSVSFDRTRKFLLKNKRTKKVIEIELEHGSLLIMRNGSNVRYLHSVPPDQGCCPSDPRMDLTFRNYLYDQEEKKITPES